MKGCGGAQGSFMDAARHTAEVVGSQCGLMEAKRSKVWFYGSTPFRRVEPWSRFTFCDTLTGMSWSNVTVRLLDSQRHVN